MLSTFLVGARQGKPSVWCLRRLVTSESSRRVAVERSGGRVAISGQSCFPWLAGAASLIVSDCSKLLLVNNTVTTNGVVHPLSSGSDHRFEGAHHVFSFIPVRRGGRSPCGFCGKVAVAVTLSVCAL